MFEILSYLPKTFCSLSLFCSLRNWAGVTTALPGRCAIQGTVICLSTLAGIQATEHIC